MIRCITILFLLACATRVAAQNPGSLVKVQLRDGTVLQGILVERTADGIVLQHELLGRLEIAAGDLRELESFDQKHPKWGRDPDSNTIMLSPTPRTVGAGDRYFRNFELFFLNFGVGVHDRLDIVAGVLFPISGELTLMAIGGKLMLLDRARHPIGLAVAGNLARLEDVEFGSGVIVAGLGNDRRSLNASIHRSFLREGDPATFYMLGADLQVARSTKLLAEFTSGLSPLFEDSDDDIDGFLNVGVRWFGEESSFSLTGIRPLGIDTDSFIAFPMAMYSRHF